MVLWLASTLAFAQEGTLTSDFRRERGHLSEACKLSGLKALPGCGIEVFTDHPLHIAAGSMPPQNGFGVGLAFVAGKNTTNWRITWDVDAVGSTNASFRAGGYMKMVHTPRESITALTPVSPGQAHRHRRADRIRQASFIRTLCSISMRRRFLRTNCFISGWGTIPYRQGRRCLV